MRKLLVSILVFACLITAAKTACAADIPRRNATRVDDVFEPYIAMEWIVSPDEEPAKDHMVTNADECDIYGVISCYDRDYLRVDILLENEISFKWDIFYALKFEYTTMNEYYFFFVDSGKLVYEKERGGKVVETKTLTKKTSKDLAGISNSGELNNSDVYFIIDKKDHIQGETGKRYFLTSVFYSGYITEDNNLKVADDTIKVEFGNTSINNIHCWRN
ncbi:MAG: hypothetical protein GX075_05180 [Firmicutes bacterium]|nr:hypothetical protein [Bacillota bacterium]